MVSQTCWEILGSLFRPVHLKLTGLSCVLEEYSVVLTTNNEELSLQEEQGSLKRSSGTAALQISSEKGPQQGRCHNNSVGILESTIGTKGNLVSVSKQSRLSSHLCVVCGGIAL